MSLQKANILIVLSNGVKISSKISGKNWRFLREVVNLDKNTSILSYYIVREDQSVVYEKHNCSCIALGFKSEKYISGGQKDLICFGYGTGKDFQKIKLSWYDLSNESFVKEETRLIKDCPIFVIGN